MGPERRLAFGSVAELYDRARPSYPQTLVDDVLEFARARPGDRALEVGAGTGKASTLFAARDLRILSLEPSEEMAGLARANLAWYENVTVEQLEFENWQPEQAFKLLFSAQAWHWIAPEVRYTRAREALIAGGALAIFWNQPRWEGNPLRAQLTDAYGQFAPELGEGAGPGPMYPGEQPQRRWWRDWKGELENAPGFGSAEARSYVWPQDYTSDQYTELLRTHSDHIVLPDGQRHALLDAVAAAIDRNGGAFTLEYVTALWLARAEPNPG